MGKGCEMEKRLLAICDLKRTAWGVGEILRWQEEALMNLYECGVDKIDEVWLYDPEDPAMRKVGVSKENSYYYLSKLLPLAYVNPHLGSFMFMDSFGALCKYVEDNLDRYHVLPALENFRKGKWLGYRMILGQLIEFHREHDFIPHLSCHPAMLLWAHHFLQRVIKARYPVVVHLRNKKIRKHCNSDYNAWFKFFEVCMSSHKRIAFIIIGTHEEIDSRFRCLGNVVFSKDFGTTVEQDCALVQSSLMFMGCSSGPEMMAAYSDIPYLLLNFQGEGHGVYKIKTGTQLPFATSLQKLVWKPDKHTVIEKEFDGLINKINLRGWRRKFMGSMDVDKLERRKGGQVSIVPKR